MKDFKDFIRTFFLKQWQYKLMSLLTAVALWFYVASSQNMSIALNVPMEFYNYPVELRLVNDFKNNVDLFLEGRRDIVTQMNKKNIKVRFDLKDAARGKNTYLITARNVEGLPSGVSMTDVSPARLILTFEPAREPAAQ